MLNIQEQNEVKQILKDLLRIESVQPQGDETLVVQYIQELFQKEDIKIQRVAKEENRQNLIATIKGGAKPPILLLSHVDVVPPQGEWRYPPFSAHEDENGVIWARGALDTKHLTAMEIMAMLKLVRQGKSFNRDIVLVASADEESGSHCGMKFLREEHPELIPTGAFTISEGGGFVILTNGKKFRTCTCGEKGDAAVGVTAYKSEEFNIFDVKTHSSYGMLSAINALSAYKSDETLCKVTQSFKEKTQEQDFECNTLKNLWEYSTKHDLQIAAFDVSYTQENINEDAVIKTGFKFIPGITKEVIYEIYLRLLKGTNAGFNLDSFEEGFESTLNSDFVDNLIDKADKFDPGSQFLPMLALGRTDGRFVRENVYGFSPMLEDLPFGEVLKKVHGVDECITVNSLIYGTNVIYSAINEICFD
ncbi:MAG: M20/M25/M40 family metallo-hydrolase [Oscillospiraceae bacterium]